MANGLIGGFGSFGQSQGQQQGNLLGNVFQQQPSRGQRRAGIISSVLQQYGGNAQQTGGAAVGGLLGLAGRALAEKTGLIDAPQDVQRAEKIRKVQERVNSQFGDQFASDPYTAFTGTAQALFDEGLTQEAFAALGEAAKYKPEPVETQRVIRGGTPEGNAAGLSEGESAIGTYVDGERTALENRQTINEETPPSRIREYEIALQRGLINRDTSLEEYNQMRAGGGRSSVTPTETQLKPYASVISSNEDLNERIRSLVENADPATLGDFNIPFTGGRDQDAVDAVSLQAQQRAAEIRSDNAELTIEQALEQAIDELSQGRGEPTPDENASGGQAGMATPQNDAYAGKVNP